MQANGIARIVEADDLDLGRRVEAQRRRAERDLGPAVVVGGDAVAGGERLVAVDGRPFVAVRVVEPDLAADVAQARHPDGGSARREASPCAGGCGCGLRLAGSAARPSSAASANARGRPIDRLPLVGRTSRSVRVCISISALRRAANLAARAPDSTTPGARLEPTWRRRRHVPLQPSSRRARVRRRSITRRPRRRDRETARCVKPNRPKSRIRIG